MQPNHCFCTFDTKLKIITKHMHESYIFIIVVMFKMMLVNTRGKTKLPIANDFNLDISNINIAFKIRSSWLLWLNNISLCDKHFWKNPLGAKLLGEIVKCTLLIRKLQRSHYKGSTHFLMHFEVMLQVVEQ